MPTVGSRKHGYYIKAGWLCEPRQAHLHRTKEAAEACEAKAARARRLHDVFSCDSCGQQFERGFYSPAQIEATLRRHEGSARHIAALNRR